MGRQGTASDENILSAMPRVVESVHFSHRWLRGTMKMDTGGAASSYNILVSTNIFLRSCRVSKIRASTLENSTDAGFLDLIGKKNDKMHILKKYITFMSLT